MEPTVTRKRASALLSEWLKQEVLDEQLFHLESAGLLPAHRTASRARPTKYTASHLVRARVALELRAVGLRAYLLRAVLDELERKVGGDWATPVERISMVTFPTNGRARLTLRLPVQQYAKEAVEAIKRENPMEVS
jgi:hypothetical protein